MFLKIQLVAQKIVIRPCHRSLPMSELKLVFAGVGCGNLVRAEVGVMFTGEIKKK